MTLNQIDGEHFSAIAASSNPTFSNVLYELELAAIKREQEGEQASAIEKIDRIWGLVTWHHPKRGRLQMPFKTLRNKLTQAKKNKSMVVVLGRTE